MRYPKAAAVAFLVFAAVATRIVGVQFGEPHIVLTAPSVLPEPVRSELDGELARALPRDRDATLSFALAFTARHLFFSLGHPTTFDFPVTPRPANCVEYSYLFVAAFNAAAERSRTPARAYRVHSGTASVFRVGIPLRGFGDHDWALVVDPSDGARLYVDPTLYDAWLGAGIKMNVLRADAIRVPSLFQGRI